MHFYFKKRIQNTIGISNGFIVDLNYLQCNSALSFRLFSFYFRYRTSLLSPHLILPHNIIIYTYYLGVCYM